MEHCVNCKNSFCELLPNEVREQICREKKKVKYKRKQVFTLLDDELMIIKSGILLQMQLNEEGEVRGVNVLGEGLIGVCRVFTEYDYPYSNYVLRELNGCIINKRLVEELCLRFPQFAKNIIMQSNKYLYLSTNRLIVATSGNCEYKINANIDIINQNLGMNIKLTHEEISILLGLSRVTVSKTLSSNSKK